MRKFTLHWLGGKTEEVVGTDIADACRRAGIGAGALPALDYFEEKGEKTMVVGASGSCGCWYHAEEGTACQHDLEIAGLK